MNKALTVLIVGTIGGSLFGCSSVDRSIEGRVGKISASGADAVMPGGHCESSALMNALRAVGWNVTESDIVGGGGAPSFMFSADGFPFLGGRSALMRETFFKASGIGYRVVVPMEGAAEEADAWSPVFALLDAGIPVPLRVDMRFLPYRYGGKFGPSYMSFGWHWITLFGVDFDKRAAFVSDTEFTVLQEIKLSDLDKARRSKTKIWPPRAEYVELARAPTNFTLDRLSLAESALTAITDNYEGRDSWSGGAAKTAAPLPIPVGIAGIEAFPAALRDFDRYAKPWIAGPALSLLAGCIERNGTGGAAFRVLFRDFVERSAADLKSGGTPAAVSMAARLAALLPALDLSIAAWRELAAEFDAAAAVVDAKTKTAERQATYERCAAKAEKVAKTERVLYEAISAACASSTGINMP